MLIDMALCTSVTVTVTTVGLWLQASVYKICKEMYCEGMEDIPVVEEPDLIGDR